MKINMNGKDTLFATGARVLTRQVQVDAEFQTACALGHGNIYLTNVRFNPMDGKGGLVKANAPVVIRTIGG